MCERERRREGLARQNEFTVRLHTQLVIYYISCVFFMSEDVLEQMRVEGGRVTVRVGKGERQMRRDRGGAMLEEK